MSADDMSNTHHIFNTFLDPGMGMEKAVNTYGAWANQYNKVRLPVVGPRRPAVVTRYRIVISRAIHRGV